MNAEKQELEDQRIIIEETLDPLDRAMKMVDFLLDSARKGEKLDIPKQYVLGDQAVMKRLNDVALQVVGRLCKLRPSEIAANHMDSYLRYIDSLLLILLGLYFNGTPQPNLSQILTDEVDRIGGLTSIAHKMKAYGDVYRIERRRWKRKNKNDSFPLGILTVVDHSIFVDENNHLRIEGKPEYDRSTCVRFRDYARMLSPDSLVAAMAERMARLYCTFQIIWYVREGWPIEIFWLPRDTSAGGKGEVSNWAGKLLRGGGSEDQKQEQEMFLVSSDKNPRLPLGLNCVLNSREGVVRDLGQHVESQTSRVTFSLMHHQMRRDIELRLKGVDGVGERLFPPQGSSNAGSAETGREKKDQDHKDGKDGRK